MRFTINFQDADKIRKRLERNVTKAEAMEKKIVNDIKGRVPAWASAGVRTVYGIAAADIVPPKIKNGAPVQKRLAGRIFTGGRTISDVYIEYTGRVLTPVHFNMTPKTPSGVIDKKGKRRPITATIKKGQRKAFPIDTFLGSNRGGGYIPFRRTTKKAYPIESVKTLSLPQMVSNEKVNETIMERVNKQMQKRLDHYMGQLEKLNQ